MEVRKYKVRWIVNAVRLRKRGKRSINLGFCEKNKRVAFASMLGIRDDYEAIKPFIVGDVYANKECEDGQYCWDLACPYNRATPETLKKYVGKNCDSETFKVISDKLQEFGRHLISKIDWGEGGAIICVEAPIIVSQKRKCETR